MYYTVCYFTAIFYAVVRQISKLFINNKDSVFIFLILPPALLAVWRGSFKFYCGNTFEPATSFDHESGALTTELFPLPACVVDSGWDFDLWFDAKCFTLLKGGRTEDESWPENIEDGQTFSSAGLGWPFYQCLNTKEVVLLLLLLFC